ncbi:MAG: DUF3467 domain-containing protein [Acidobacteriota bacterium]
MPEQDKPQMGTVEPEEVQMVEFSIKIEASDTYVYSNVAGISISPWDLRINFADVNVVNKKDEAFKAVMGIVMPPEHAAGLTLLLMRQLRNYEEQFGAIRHPDWQAMKARSKKTAEDPKESRPQEKTKE